MQVVSDQLVARLGESLKPVYLIHGEEILTKIEAADAVRAAARKAGYSEREHFIVEAHFDWSLITQSSDNLYFSQRCASSKSASTRQNRPPMRVYFLQILRTIRRRTHSLF